MLRITRQTDYGILLMTEVARNAARKIHKTRDLASLTRIPVPMVSKILKSLAKKDLLISHRGVNGGYSLARLPEDISVAEMIDALEGFGLTECVDQASNGCIRQEGCPVHANWSIINRAIRNALQGISLVDMAQPLPQNFQASGDSNTNGNGIAI